jgi:hypothetical protein
MIPSRHVRLSALLSISLLTAAGACGRGAGDPPRARDAAAPPTHDAGTEPARAAWLDEVTVHGAAPPETRQLEIIDGELWAASGQQVFRYSLAGGPGRVLEHQAGGAHVHIEAGAVTAILSDSGEIVRFPDGFEPGQGMRESLGRSAELPTPAGILGLGPDLVWATDQGLFVLPRQGGRIRVLARGVVATGPLAVQGDALVFSDGTHLRRAAARTGKIRAVAPAPGRVRSIQPAGDRVYWMDESRISSAPIGGAGAVVVHAELEAQGSWLAVGGDHLVWLEHDADGAATVRSLALPEGAPTVLLRAPLGRAGAGLVHEGRIYFTSDAERIIASRPLAP